MKINTIAICFILLSISCMNNANDKKDAVEIIRVETVYSNDTLNMKDISEVELIKIKKNSNQNYIGRITKILKNDNRLFISDKSQIKTYTNSGDYVFTLNKQGRAKNEYLSIYDFDVMNERIYLLDRDLKRILIYDLNGNFCSGFDFDFFARSIKVMDSETIIIVADNDIKNNHRIHMFNINQGKRTHSYLEMNPYKNKYLKYFWTNNFYAQNDLLFYYEMNDNTIKQLTIDNCSDYKKLDFGGNNAPDEFYNVDYENIMNFLEQFNNKGYATGVSWAAWTKNSFVASFVHDRKTKFIVSKNGETKLYNGIELENNLIENGFFVQDDMILSYQYPNDINTADSVDVTIICGKLN